MSDKKGSSEREVDKVTEADGTNKTRKVTVLLVKDEDAKTTITIEMPRHETEKDVVLRIFRMGSVLKEYFGFEMADDCLVRIGRANNSHYLVEVKPLAISTPVIVTAVDDPRFQYVFEIESPTVRPAKNESFSQLLNSPKFSDVTLCVGDKKMYAHKVVLANKSPVFDALLDSKCTKIEIEDFSYDTIFDLLHFIYKGKVTNDIAGSDLFPKFSNLLKADAKYCVEHLKEMCQIRLSMIITIENVLECFRLADSYNGIYLKKYALDFAVTNAQEIVNMPSFKNFDTLHPDLLVEMMQALVINKNN